MAEKFNNYEKFERKKANIGLFFSYENMSLIKVGLPFLNSSIKKLVNIWLIFDIEK